jgi:hypothetical protein
VLTFSWAGLASQTTRRRKARTYHVLVLLNGTSTGTCTIRTLLMQRIDDSAHTQRC